MLRQKRLLRENLVISKLNYNTRQNKLLPLGSRQLLCNCLFVLYPKNPTNKQEGFFDIANLSELGKLNFRGGQQFLPSLKARGSEML